MKDKISMPEYHVKESTFCGCGINDKNPYKDDCYFYHSEPSMGGHISCCKFHKGLGNCPCEKCDRYLSRHDAFKIIVEHLKNKEKIKENMSTIAIKTSLRELPKYCDDCLYYECRPHPYKGWSDSCGLCTQCLDDDNGDDGWVYDGNGRPKKCPLMEVVENENNSM